MRKTFFTLLSLALFVVAVSPTNGADPSALDKLDQALKSAIQFEHGTKTDALKSIESIVFAAVKDSTLREPVERKLIDALVTSKSPHARSFLCRQLRTIGTAQCIPTMETLLPDPKLSHMARYVLARITDPKATEALLRGLDNVHGEQRIGIINTLGDKRDSRATQQILHFLNSNDPALAGAAANALGKIGGASATQVLQSARTRASGSLANQIDNALISCADSFLAKNETKKADKIYRVYYDKKQPTHLRIAGLRGLLACDTSQSTKLIQEAMESPELRASAIAFARDFNGKDSTRILTELMPKLPSDAQELLVSALGERRDAAARQAVTTAATSDHENVRIAAITALGKLGDSANLELLIDRAAHTEGQEQRASRESLLRLPGPKVNSQLSRFLRSDDNSIQRESIRAIVGRKASSNLEQLVPLVNDENEEVRHATIRAIGTLATEQHLSILINLALSAKSPATLEVIENSMEGAFRRLPDDTAKTGTLLAALNHARDSVVPALVRLLGTSATPAGLAAVRGALSHKDEAIRDAAVRTISSWPNASPADDVLQLIKESEGSHRIIALRGYTRMASMGQNPAAMYGRAMKLAQRDEDKKLVLAGLANGTSRKALDLALSLVTNENLRTEAELAAVKILRHLRQNDAEHAHKALTQLVGSTQNESVKGEAQAMLNDMEKYQGFILSWLGSGLYREEGKSEEALLQLKSAPESDKASEVSWSPISKGIKEWSINLEAEYGKHDNVSAYVKTRLWSPSDQSAQLELGSDDGIKAWINGKEVYSLWATRPVVAGQDKIPVELKKGWNDIMLKIVDGGGDWGFACRVRNARGGNLDGIRVSPK